MYFLRKKNDFTKKMNKFVTLLILMLMFLLEELYYWLPVTTTAKLANKAHFGNWHISNEVRDELDKTSSIKVGLL